METKKEPPLDSADPPNYPWPAPPSVEGANTIHTGAAMSHTKGIISDDGNIFFFLLLLTKSSATTTTSLFGTSCHQQKCLLKDFTLRHQPRRTSLVEGFHGSTATNTGGAAKQQIKRSSRSLATFRMDSRNAE